MNTDNESPKEPQGSTKKSLPVEKKVAPPIISGLQIGSTKNNAKKGVKVLTYGFSGMGKTTSIKGEGDNIGCPRGQTLVVSTESKGVRPLVDADFDLISISSWVEFQKNVDILCQNPSLVARYQVIVLDGLSALSGYLENYILDTVRPETRSRSTSSRLSPYDDALEIAEYKVFTKQIKRYLDKFIALDTNIIVNCLVDDNPKIDIRFKPEFSTRFKDSLPSLFDIVLYMDKLTKQIPLKNESGEIVGYEEKTGVVWYTTRPDTVAKAASGKPLKDVMKTDYSLIFDFTKEETS